MPTARLSVTLPESTWIATLSTQHPDAVIRVLAALPDGETGVGLVEVTAPDVDGVVETMRGLPGLTSLDVLHRTDEEALVQFGTTEPVLLLTMRNSGTPLEPPVTISDGEATLQVRTSQDRLSALADQLRAFGLRFEVHEVSDSVADRESVVSESQRELLETAVEKGYYDVPRTCTLTELAADLDIAKSTASERLHRAESAVMRAFVDED
ncbi:MAG: helix-turn-helix domain-containing protein [Haloplanus sp.]